MKYLPHPRLARVLVFAFTLLSGCAISHASSPAFVSTFHCIGIYWKPESGGTPIGATNRTCIVEYRPSGGSTWMPALPLWFDAETVPSNKPAGRINEYRGSIVDLLPGPGSTYDVRLTLLDSNGTQLEQQQATVSMMSETFLEDAANTVLAAQDIANHSASTSFTTTRGGSEANGYVVYDFATHPIDVANNANTCITINHSYVIIRNATLKGAAKHGVEIADNTLHHVVIEGCDISGWGSFTTYGAGGTPTFLGTDGDAGIYTKSNTLSDVVIQRNRIHNPRTRSNSWHTGYLLGQTEGPPSSGHTKGPMGINFLGKNTDESLRGTAGHHIIRYNEIYSSDGFGDVTHPYAGHGFDDGIGGDYNTSLAGFPGKDSDIYCNYVANCWDDGIEAEGGGLNVRVWGNFVEHAFSGFAYAGNSMGPLYSFRNIVGFSRYDPQDMSVTADPSSIRLDATDATGHADYPDGGVFIKVGNNSGNYTRGRIYLLHNTSLQPWFIAGVRKAGVDTGIAAATRSLRNLYGRNNILEIRDAAGGNSITIAPKFTPFQDIDYDLANGRTDVGAQNEQHRFAASPTYASTPTLSAPAQSSSSAGFNTAIPLANFDTFFTTGIAGDIGAVEPNMDPVGFGIAANWSDYLINGAGSGSTVTAPTITTLSLPSDKELSSYNETLSVTGGSGTLTWVVDSGALPAGLMLSSTTGAITGTVSATGVFGFTVRVTDANGAFDRQALSIVVHPRNNLLGALLAPTKLVSDSFGEFTQPLTVQYTVGLSGRRIDVILMNGSAAVQTWSSEPLAVGSGTASFTVDPTGLAAGSSYFWRAKLIRIDTGATVSTPIDVTGISAVANSQPAITTASPLPSGAVGAQYNGNANGLQLQATGGDGSLQWSISSGTLPEGFNLSKSGQLKGNAPSQGGAFTFTLRANDSDQWDHPGDYSEQTFSLTIAGSGSVPSVATTGFPNGAVGHAFSAALAGTNGDGALTWSLDSGTLPAGLTLGTDGLINGAPTTGGSYPFTVRVADSDLVTGFTDEGTKNLSISIFATNSVPTIPTSSPLPSGNLGVAYSQALSASGGNGVLTLTVVSGPLPPGLSMTTSGTISGTPIVSGSYTFTVKVADDDAITGAADEGTAVFVLVVN